MKTPVFDIGDTLVPSHEKTTEKIREVLGDVPHFPINEYNVFVPAEVDEWMRENGIEGDPEEVSGHYKKWVKTFLEENAVPALEEISSRHGPIGFISDNSIEAKKTYQKVFDRSDINYSGFVVSGEVGVEKPDPKIFQEFVDRRSESPGEFVYFGNYVDRDRAAEKIGMEFVWVTTFHTFGSSYSGRTIQKITPEAVERAL